MKKIFSRFSIVTSIKIGLALATLSIVLVGFMFYNSENEFLESDNDAPQQDRPDLAREQDALRTMDPSLGYVPSERLSTVFNIIKQQQSQKNSNPDPLSTATWVERGPGNIGGRTRALMFDPNDVSKKKVWAGGVGGGLWYTNDITATSPAWVNVNDFWANIAISCIAFSPANTNTFYVGTGEGWYNSDAIRGNGIWKTADGGISWNQLASTTSSTFYNVQKIVVTNNGNVYAATRDGGLRRSTDGGTTWSQVLAGRAADLEIAADGTLFATIGIFSSGGIYSSADGTTWNLIYDSATDEERIEIACAPSNVNRLYAMVQDASTAGLKKIMQSTDKGVTWTSVTKPTWCDQGTTSSDMTRGQAWYDMIAAVDPNNANTLFVGGVDIMRSTNSGSTWTQVSRWSTSGSCTGVSMHADQHAIVFAPGSSYVILFGNDGGVYYTSNGGTAISNKNTGYNVTQFYACAIHPTAAQNYFLAGAQDNGTQKFSSAGMNSTTQASGGDGAFCFIDRDNPSYQISSYVRNHFYRSTNGGTSFTKITSNNYGSFINPADYDDVNNVLYSGYDANNLYRITGITGTPSAGTISISGMASTATHIRVSPHTSTTIFVGCGDGKVFRVTNANGSPTSTNISTGLPSGSVSCIEVGATNNDLLVTYSNYGRVSVWTSSNGGTSWTNREGNLPDMPVRWALFNPNDHKEVFLATEVGIWSTTDIGVTSPTWTANNTGLANVRVDMLQLRSSDKEVIAATHGRGLFSTNVFGLCGTPANLSATNITSYSATFNWTAISGATIYSVRYKPTASATWSNFTTSNISAVENTLQASTQYEFQVQAICSGGGISNYSASSIFTTLATTCGTPGSLSATNITSNSATLNWTAVSGATSYSIRYKLTSSSTWGIISSPTNSQSLNSLSGASQYEFQVRALCSGGGVSNYSASSLFTTPIAITTQTVTVGTGTGETTAGSPYRTNYMDERYQFIITKAELTAGGWTSANSYLRSLAFYVTTASPQMMNGFTIKVRHTTGTYFGSSSFLSTTNMTTVYSGNHTAVANSWNTHTFSTPFMYNGVDNLLIQICWNNSTQTTNSNVKYTPTSNYKTLYYLANKATTGVCTNTTGHLSYNRPNTKLVFKNNATGKYDSGSEVVLEAETQELNIMLYPNPASSVLNVDYEVMEENSSVLICIYDMKGALLTTKQYDNVAAGNHTHTIDFNSETRTSSMTSGIFLCRVNINGKMGTKRFMLMK